MTAVMYALENDNLESAKELLAHGGNADANRMVRQRYRFVLVSGSCIQLAWLL